MKDLLPAMKRTSNLSVTHNGKNPSKKKDVLILPGETKIYQSNRIARGKFKGFTLIQLKVFATIIKQLQNIIIGEINRKEGQQMALFASIDSFSCKEYVKIPLLLHEITSFQNYKNVVVSVDEMRQLAIELPAPEGYAKTISSVIVKYDIPRLVRGKSVLNVYLPREVAARLVFIDRDEKGHAREYHNYFYNVIMASTSKYTFKLYLLLCLWKNKGSFRLSYQDLREQLGLQQGQYTAFKNFKARILLPAQRELKNKADCWFDCSKEGFEERSGKTVRFLCFKIITSDNGNDQNDYSMRLTQWFQTQLRFKQTDMRFIAPLFKNIGKEEFESIMETCASCLDMYYKKIGTQNPIRNLTAYIIHSLRQEYPQSFQQ